jgi:ATP-binding cassette subfamily C protein LapB
MKELYARLFARPALAAELITASLFIAILALASPLFVMQVLNRYVAQGVDATLITLTTGVLIAVALEFIFREARTKLATRVSTKPDSDIADSSFNVLTKSRLESLEKVPPEMRREILTGIGTVEQAFSANNISAVLDVPFALLFLLVLYLLSPTIAFVVGFFIVLVFVIGILGQAAATKKSMELTNESGKTSALLSTAIREGETVRVFNAGALLRKSWNSQSGIIQSIRRQLNDNQGLVQSLTQTVNALMSVIVIVVAGVLTVRGQLDVGAMMGTNMLSARALQPISRFAQLGGSFVKARQALAVLREFAKMPIERDRGSAIADYKGGLEFRDLSFSHQGTSNPLLESLDLKLEPGSVLVVTGSNGTGKTTFARLILGLFEPTRGFILADGLDLKQAAAEWWRKQVVYLPQEPALLNATLVENLTVNNPEADPKRVNEIIDLVGLRRFVDESQNGIEMQIVDNGWRLSEGIRRRIALARGLLTDGRLVVFDEPTESFDADGIATVHNILGKLAREGRTIIVISHDARIVKGRHVVLDLNSKPTPTVSHVPGVVAAEAQIGRG